MNNESPSSLTRNFLPRGRSTACSEGHQLPAPTTEEEMNALRAMRHVGYGGPFDTAYQLEDRFSSATANPEKYYGNVYNTIVTHVDRISDGMPTVAITVFVQILFNIKIAIDFQVSAFLLLCSQCNRNVKHRSSQHQSSMRIS